MALEVSAATVPVRTLYLARYSSMLSEPNAKSGKDRICSVCDVIEATHVGLGDLQPYTECTYASVVVDDEQ